MSLVLVAEVLPEVGTSQHFPGDRIAKLEVDDAVFVEAVEARELLALDAGRVEVTEEWLVLWLSSSEWTVHRNFGMLALKPPASRVVQGVMHQERGLKPVKTFVFTLDIVLGTDAKVVVEDNELIHPIVTLLRHTVSGSFFCESFFQHGPPLLVKALSQHQQVEVVIAEHVLPDLIVFWNHGRVQVSLPCCFLRVSVRKDAIASFHVKSRSHSCAVGELPAQAVASHEAERSQLSLGHLLLLPQCNLFQL